MNALMSMMPFGDLPGVNPKRRNPQNPIPLGMPQGSGKGQPLPFAFPNAMQPFGGHVLGNSMMNFQPLMNYGRRVQRY